MYYSLVDLIKLSHAKAIIRMSKQGLRLPEIEVIEYDECIDIKIDGLWIESIDADVIDEWVDVMSNPRKAWRFTKTWIERAATNQVLVEEEEPEVEMVDIRDLDTIVFVSSNPEEARGRFTILHEDDHNIYTLCNRTICKVTRRFVDDHRVISEIDTDRRSQTASERL